MTGPRDAPETEVLCRFCYQRIVGCCGAYGDWMHVSAGRRSGTEWCPSKRSLATPWYPPEDEPEDAA